MRRSLPYILAGLALAAGALPLPKACGAVPSLERIGQLLSEPSPADWRKLSRFDGTVTRTEFETRLARIFDPGGGLKPFLRINDTEMVAFADEHRIGEPLVTVHFIQDGEPPRPPPVTFRTIAAFRRGAGATTVLPLRGLRIVIEPADIGGAWAKAEDRSVDFAGFGRISEGDINLTVARLLDERLTRLGAIIFLVRDRTEPVLGITFHELPIVVRAIIDQKPDWITPPLRHRAESLTKDPTRQLQIAGELLLTKTAETRARVDYVRRSFTPDLTIVLQHNATADSGEGKITAQNRNIFFVSGAYTAAELAETPARFRLLTKVFENVSPIEIPVAAAIAAHFQSSTGYAPVRYGNSATTRIVLPHNDYVVARNLAFNREHDGPVVVTEPYFMNQPETLARLLAGDFAGERLLAGKMRVSIYREYADSVAAGLIEAYQGAQASK